MKIVNRNRQTGKTTMLIHTSYLTGYPIVVQDAQRAYNVTAQAEQLGCKISVITASQLRQNGVPFRDGVLVDEGEDLIKRALEEYLKTKVVACTVSIPCEGGSSVMKEAEKD